MPGLDETREQEPSEYRQEKTVHAVAESDPPASPEPMEEKPASPVTEASPEPVVPAAHEALNGKTENGASPRIDTPAPFAIRWDMASKLTWRDADDIAYALIDAYPDQDPLKLSFPKLHKMITELEDFSDNPDKSSESILEAIQMAWYEEVK